MSGNGMRLEDETMKVPTLDAASVVAEAERAEENEDVEVECLSKGASKIKKRGMAIAKQNDALVARINNKLKGKAPDAVEEMSEEEMRKSGMSAVEIRLRKARAGKMGARSPYIAGTAAEPSLKNAMQAGDDNEDDEIMRKMMARTKLRSKRSSVMKMGCLITLELKSRQKNP